MITYLSLPKENFPEVVFPQIYVSTIYRGSPTDIENLISKEIEKEVKSIEGVKKITSNSIQNYSSVIIEFETDKPEFTGEMTMTVQLADDPGGTNVTLRYDNVPPAIRPEDNAEGSRQSLNKLAALLE